MAVLVASWSLESEKNRGRLKGKIASHVHDGKTCLMSTSKRTIYQLKVVLLGVSPMTWCRLLVCSNSTITDWSSVGGHSSF